MKTPFYLTLVAALLMLGSLAPAALADFYHHGYYRHDNYDRHAYHRMRHIEHVAMRHERHNERVAARHGYYY